MRVVRVDHDPADPVVALARSRSRDHIGEPPGGGIEADEDPLTAARREPHGEAGLLGVFVGETSIIVPPTENAAGQGGGPAACPRRCRLMSTRNCHDLHHEPACEQQLPRTCGGVDPGQGPASLSRWDLEKVAILAGAGRRSVDRRPAAKYPGGFGSPLACGTTPALSGSA
ncbi:NUDIX hydrolase [Streptomyces vinaceus]